jgi:hypothetical protein
LTFFLAPSAFAFFLLLSPFFLAPSPFFLPPPPLPPPFFLLPPSGLAALAAPSAFLALALAMWMIEADHSPKIEKESGFSREFETRGSDASDRTDPWLTNFLL